MTKENSAPVSVIIPCYCSTATIARAIKSIANQTAIPAEIILIDDCSQDAGATVNELQVLQYKYADRLSIKIIRLSENAGAASARNRGWEAASQPYIAFLDADDAWHPKKLEIQYAYMASHPEVVLSGHAHRILIGDAEELNWDVQECTAMPVSKRDLLISNRFVTPSAMLKRDIPYRFAEKRRHMEDHLLWLEIVCGQMVVTRLNAELAAIFKPAYGATGLSAQLWSMELGDLKNYSHLYGIGCINDFQWLGFCVFSILKFVRRILIYWGYIRWIK